MGMTVITPLLYWLSWIFLLLSAGFFIAGTVGMLRFPDIYSRLHAVTKADTLGLGLLVIGLSLRADDLYSVGIMILIWLLVMGSGATACQLLARYGRESEGDTEADDVAS
ncbi:MAG: monovalent cation/H(+) antiporter subunit G [Natronospirillum sp.]|uniref:cation:proton antiporter n=1 Tax=Natronospirillum sp. TaxID=2812955 RepID=UPI0025D69817|nr:monovalent cation/H(+) antiporter subunit G [Natronospirillum sp.]MCH8551538.1 monovalent cation/H(+) antiporter subunit G [Natronospirillum sp.]